MSYTIMLGGKAIHCGTCGRISHNPKDIEERYCGHCNVFHLHEGLFGVFDNRGFLLVADERQDACNQLVERWRAIAGGEYIVRRLTPAEEALARRWRDSTWLNS